MKLEAKLDDCLVCQDQDGIKPDEAYLDGLLTILWFIRLGSTPTRLRAMIEETACAKHKALIARWEASRAEAERMASATEINAPGSRGGASS